MDMLEIDPKVLAGSHLSVNAMANYLVKSGWQQVPNHNDRLMLFQGVTDDYGNPVLLSLPRNDGFGDVLRRLAEAVNLVAAIEERHPEAILAEAQASTLTTD
jgi:hypothetical protein